MTRSFNARTFELIPYLQPPADGVNPVRSAIVRHAVETTYMVPGDWPDDKAGRWFYQGSPPKEATEVEYLINDGVIESTFPAMLDAFDTATTSDHFVILLGWSLQLDFDLSDGKGKTFLDVARELAKRGVCVRVLLFDNTEYQINDNTKARLNELRAVDGLNVTCELDDHTQSAVPLVDGVIELPSIPELGPDYERLRNYAKKGNPGAYGAHHHKILLVKGTEGLIGFCGGMDLDPNRAGSTGFLHDVHVRVVGGAAKDLFRVAHQRWTNAKDNGKRIPPIDLPAGAESAVAAEAPPATASQWARVVETVGNPDIRASVPNTLWRELRHALRTASRFIYIEDQYLWSFDLVDELVDAAPRVHHITVVLPHGAERIHLRHRAIARLVERGGADIKKKVGIYQKMESASRPWIHAKLAVVDDEFAIVGSANANNRGYFIDSEAAVAIAEREWRAGTRRRGGGWYVAEANFARRMRMDLWQGHLGVDHDEVYDGVGARIHFIDRSPLATVEDYQIRNVQKDRALKLHAEWVKRRDKAFAEGKGKDFHEDPPDIAEKKKGDGSVEKDARNDPVPDPFDPKKDIRKWYEEYDEDWDIESPLVERPIEDPAPQAEQRPEDEEPTAQGRRPDPRVK